MLIGSRSQQYSTWLNNDFSFLQKLPKSELHLHLDGSIRPSTVVELAKEQKVSIPTYNEFEMKKLLSVGGKVGSLEEYLKAFDITLSVLQKPYAIKRTIYEVCEDAHKSGINYIEIRFSPILHTKEGLELSTIMESCSEGISEAMLNFPIIARIIVCGMRNLPSSSSTQLAEIAWRYKENGFVVGFDLAGPEIGYTSKTHSESFKIVRNKLLHCTLHSGEAGDWSSISDSIHYCGGQRIGHGVQLKQNQSLLNYVAQKKIAIEINLTSNLQTKAVDSIINHPVKLFYDSGIPISICTDNTTMSETDLNKEYQIFLENFSNISYNDLTKILSFGYSYSFLSGKLKHILRKKSVEKSIEILQENFPSFPLIEEIKKDPFYFQFDLEFNKKFSFFVENKEKNFEKPSLHLIQKLKKADLNKRFEGSMTRKFLWNQIELNRKKLEEKLSFIPKNIKEFSEMFIYSEDQQKEKEIELKKIIKLCLQTKEQIFQTMENIVENAVKDNIVYLELTVRLSSHLEGQNFRNEEEVLKLFLVCIDSMESLFDIKINLILFVNPFLDEFQSIQTIANLCKKYQGKGVVGFGILGSEMEEKKLEKIKPILDELKHNQLNVSICAGRTNPINIIEALHLGGANRISAPYSLHKNPELLSYLADRSIPVELTSSIAFKKYSKELCLISSKNPIRLYFDQQIPVLLCSFHSIFSKEENNNIQQIDEFDSNKTISQVIYEMSKENQMSTREILKLLQTGFTHNFENENMRKRMMESIWKEWENEIMKGKKSQTNLYDLFSLE